MAAPNLSELATVAIDSRTRQLADNLSNNTQLLKKLKSKGKVQTVSGGEAILQEIMYAENSTFKRYSGYEALDISPSEGISAAKFPWRQAAVSVMISGKEEKQVRGKEEMIPLLKSRVLVAERTMTNQISGDIYSTGTADNGKQIGGLQLLVATSPNTGTVGGINRANFEFWRNKATTAALTSANIKSEMQKMWLKLVRNMDKPDLIVKDNINYQLYWESLSDLQRFAGGTKGDSMDDSLLFSRCPVVMDGGQGGDAPEKSSYFLNCEYIHYRPHAQGNMVAMSGERYSINQDAMVKLILFMGNMTVSNAELQGVLKGS
jgi:hypothetical protein